MIPRSELFGLKHGEGCIEVRGDALAIALFVNGNPMSANWDAHVGSILEYFYLKECFSNEGADGVRGLVGCAPLPDRSLADQFAPILRKLPAGPYRLGYEEERGGSCISRGGIHFRSDVTRRLQHSLARGQL